MNRDSLLHEGICRAEQECGIDIGVELRPLNRPGSPVYSMWENATPAFVLAGGVIAVWVFAGWIWALSALASGVILMLSVVNMLVMTRVRRRTLRLALADAAGWNALWDEGVLSLRMRNRTETECSGGSE